MKEYARVQSDEEEFWFNLSLELLPAYTEILDKEELERLYDLLGYGVDKDETTHTCT